MTEAARQARNEYMKTYRATHREKVREYNNRYWEKKAAEIAEEGKTTEGDNSK